MRGQATLIEGFGFGATPGAVAFPAAGGGTVSAPAPDSADWSDEAVRVTVPATAASGTLQLTTAGGARYTAAVHVVPAVPFVPDSLTWLSRVDFPRAPVGIALAAREVPAGAAFAVTLFAAGGAEPLGGDSAFVPDSGVYVAPLLADGSYTGWVRQRDTSDVARNRSLPAPRAFAAAVVATRYNSRFDGAELLVIGGIDSSGTAQASVLAAPVANDTVAGPFQPLTPLPAPVAGAIAVMRRGRIYVIGGTDSIGVPQANVYVGRIGVSGEVDGWYAAPALPAPRAYGGGVALDDRIVAFGGVADSVPPGGGLDATPARLASSDTAGVSLASGFFTGAWAAGPAALPEGRAQFVTLDAGSAVLAVGGLCDGGVVCPAETVAAARAGDSLGAFTAAATRNTIAGADGSAVVAASGVTWRAADGSYHGLVVGGFDFLTRRRVASAWGF